MLRATLRSHEPHGFASFVREPLFDERRIVECSRHQNFFWWLPFFVIELLDRGADQLFVAGVAWLSPEKIFAADQQSAAHKQQLKVCRGSLPRQADHILIGGADLSDALFFQGPF